MAKTAAANTIRIDKIDLFIIALRECQDVRLLIGRHLITRRKTLKSISLREHFRLPIIAAYIREMSDNIGVCTRKEVAFDENFIKRLRGRVS